MQGLAAPADPQASGETRAPRPTGQTENLVRIARAVLDDTGYSLSRPKVSRLVRRYEAHVSGNGWSFFEFFANAIQLDSARRRELSRNPEIARVISYADPTGETAVARVMRERRAR